MSSRAQPIGKLQGAGGARRTIVVAVACGGGRRGVTVTAAAGEPSSSRVVSRGVVCAAVAMLFPRRLLPLQSSFVLVTYSFCFECLVFCNRRPCPREVLLSLLFHL